MEPDLGDPERVALITGTSRGLGRVLAGFLAKQGYGLIVTARNGVELNASGADLRSRGSPVVSVGGDVSDAAHRQRLVDAAAKWGRLDLLVNNASELGDTPLPPLAEASRENLRRVFDVNVLGPIALVREALPLLERAHGLVVNITSDAAVGGYPGWGAGYGFGFYGQIPQDKQARLRELGVETQRKVIGLQADYEGQVAAYLRAVDTYPLDAAAATKAWDAMQGLSRQMFQLRLEAMAKAQQIMGKELWDQLREGRGLYFGAPPRR